MTTLLDHLSTGLESYFFWPIPLFPPSLIIPIERMLSNADGLGLLVMSSSVADTSCLRPLQKESSASNAVGLCCRYAFF